jgi:hypothetical protein
MATRKTPTKRKAAVVAPAAPAPRYQVEIRSREGATMHRLSLYIDDTAFYPDVQRWRYVVANRKRITPAAREALRLDMARWMAIDICRLSLAAFDATIAALARAEFLEVSIPYASDDVGWSARLFPWESALGLLTQPHRTEGREFTVLRHLASSKPPPPLAVPLRTLLVVRSGPGALAKLYDLERECAMVSESLQPMIDDAQRHQLNEPDRQALAARIATLSPSIVHLSGVDPWALESQGLQKAAPDNPDGFVLGRAETGFDSVPPPELATLLAGGKTRPLLVAVSSCYSAQRICALAVARGASHAIGFVDTLTDADAMLFFSSFYRTWAQDGDLVSAFAKARAIWATQTATQGAGVVLWSSRSFFEKSEPTRRAGPPASPSTSATVPVPATEHDLRIHVELNLDRANDSQREPTTSLNYSLLHNDRSPFKTFLIQKPRAGKLPPLQVEVALEVGSDLCRCRFSEELPEDTAPLELAPRIRLPLVAGLLRQCTESLRTNLYVKVSCGERLLLEISKRVTVLPADEWRDDGEDHRWLPSFVLPRDPAVLKVIDVAQRYLRTLLDDCACGFDGYQQLLDDDSNSAAVVDPQVQAIWAALQHDLAVSYINPPPSYTSQSQRLRTPSEIFRGRAATCIDLALLFASCLEFVGIYPVVFLISGHAFPGYWRSDKAWWNMKQFRFDKALPGDGMPTALPGKTGTTGGQSESWMFNGAGNLGELLRYVQDGTLVPFESTFVAAQRGFFASLEEGSARLHPESFDSMVDIQSARAANVTPLPLFDKFS